MITYKEYFLFNEAAGPNKHLTHLEELILTNGTDGALRAIKYLQELTKVLDSDTPKRRAINTTVKYDGAPAVVVGADPNGKFFVGSKSVFAKTPKLNYSIEDIKRNHSQSPGLVDKLVQTFVNFKDVRFNSVYQGDFLFDDQIKEISTIDGEEHVTFKPNTILYAVPTDSEEGQQIVNANIGVVFHTEYNVRLDNQNLPRFQTKQFGVDVTNINPGPKVYVKDAFFENDAGHITLTSEETDFVIASINSAKQSLSNIDFDKVTEQMLASINTYINTEIRAGEFLEDGAVSYQKFMEWFESRQDKNISSRKSDAGIARAKKAKQVALKFLNEAKEDILNIFEFQKAIKQSKDIFIKKYNNMMQGVQMRHYLFDDNGDLVVTEPEGYVAIDASGNAVKFVDRLEFSRANFAVDKDSKFKKN